MKLVQSGEAEVKSPVRVWMSDNHLFRKWTTDNFTNEVAFVTSVFRADIGKGMEYRVVMRL